MLITSSFSSIPEEKELTFIQGRPTEAKAWYKGKDEKKIQSVTFTLQKIKVEYESGDLHFPEVFAAVKQQVPLKVWFYKREGGPVPLYKLVVGNKTILSYQEKAAAEKKSYEASRNIGLFFMAATTISFFWSRRRGNNSAVRR